MLKELEDEVVELEVEGEVVTKLETLLPGTGALTGTGVLTMFWLTGGAELLMTSRGTIGFGEGGGGILGTIRLGEKIGAGVTKILFKLLPILGLISLNRTKQNKATHKNIVVLIN